MASAARILSISHDKSILTERQNVLQTEGYSVTSAQSVRELLTSFLLKFDLIIVDHDIPLAEKRRLLDELRKRGCDAPVLGLFRAGVEHIGNSPSPEKVLRSVRSILGEHGRTTRVADVNVSDRRQGDRRVAQTRTTERRSQRPSGIVSTRDKADRRRQDRRKGENRRRIA